MFGETAIIKSKSLVMDRLISFFSSEYAVGALAFCSLCSALFGLELFFYSLVCLAGIFVCLCGRDFRFFVPAALYCCTAISNKNNPNINPASPIYPWNGFWVVIVLGVLLAAALLFRVSRMGKAFFHIPRKFTRSFLIFGAALLVGCFGGITHFWLNLRYAAVLFASLFAFYYILVAAVDWKSVKKEYFAWVLFFLSLSVSGQLIALYLGNGVIVNGQIWRSQIFVGWGTYNNLGLMLLLGMPAAFYLATVRKNGYAFNLFGNYFYLCILLSNSRTCIMMGAVAYFLCMYFVLRARNGYRGNLAVFGVAFGAFLAVFLLFGDKVFELFAGLIAKGTGSNGRDVLYENGAFQFFASPIIGKGFFAGDETLWWTVAGVNLIPPLYHNTFIQMLASCGFVGLCAYLYHRLDTFWHFWQRRQNKESIFLGICLLAFLLTNLLDCHFFLLGPGLFYSAYLAVAEKTGAGTGSTLFFKKGELL